MAQNTSLRRDSHSTTSSDSGWSSKRIAVTALFCACSAICATFLQIPIIPGVGFLKYDPSCIIALVGGFAYGPLTGLVVSTVSYLPILGTSGGFYGMIMEMIAAVTTVLPASIIYRRNPTQKGAIIGMLVGAIVCLVCIIGANLIITPLYTGTSREAVIGLIVPALLPFNIIKIAINCVVTGLIYKPISKALGD